jgi:peptidoglycan-associated lipoprotein
MVAIFIISRYTVVYIKIKGKAVKLSQWMKTLVTCGSLILLVGCHTARKDANNLDVNAENSAYSSTTEEGAQTSGAGSEAGINEGTDINSEQQAAKRTYYFDFDSNVVLEKDMGNITANAEYLVSHATYKIMLEGHTDPRGSREYNIGLGERRAKAVAQVLTAKGVNPAQIRIVSYGAEKRAGIGRAEADFQLDRRVTLVYLQS